MTNDSGRLRIWLHGLVILAVACLASRTDAAPPAQLEPGQRAALLCAEELPMQAKLARDDLVQFLQQSLGMIVCRYPATSNLKELEEPVCLVFGTKEENPAVAGLMRKAFLPATDGLGAEGSHVKAGQVDSKLVVALTGNTLTGASYAVYSFLENELDIGFFIDGTRVPQPKQVDLAGLDRTETPAVPIRGLFYHHTWKSPHANSWRLWDFDGWKESIDWMRRKRFNVVPMMCDTGGYMWGDVIFKTFQIPKNDKTLAQFVVDPAWRRELNKKIFAYARESGVRIAYNLFYSQVPEFFADYYPQIKYHELNMRNVGINADQPECKQIMKRYWKAILDTYGLDDSHIYLVCPYRHERVMGEGFAGKNSMTNAAWEILKELDPEATMYVESWCWKYRDEKKKTRETLDANPTINWRDFDSGVPKEVGVVEWDVRRSHPTPVEFGGRPYIQLTHTNMENWWPPNAHRNHPQWLINYFEDAIDHGARGVLFFHIQANTSEMIADLASRIGWKERPDLKQFYQNYALRRFGDRSIDVISRSMALLCDGVDFGQNREDSPFPPSPTSPLTVPLAPPTVMGSAEEFLAQCEETGAARKAWIESHLQVFRAKRKLASEAMFLARSVASTLENEPFFKKYLWELDYVAARYEGIENMYLAHLLADTDPAQAAMHFDRALDAFFAVKELFRDKPRHRMSEIRRLEPNVPYTAAFLKDWEYRGFWEPKIHSFSVIWEHFDHLEDVIRALRPEGLPDDA